MQKKSLRGSFLKARRGTFCLEPARALLSAAQSQFSHRGHPTHRARPPAPRSLRRRPPVLFLLSMAVPCRDFFAQSPRCQLKSTKTNTTALMFAVKVRWLSPTTDTCPTDSRALGVGWVAWFGFPCYGPGLSVGRTKKIARPRSCDRHDRRAVLACSWRIRHISGCL